ncbi:MAG TPA: ATP synthase subunit C, partial [Aminivibrio sp.]|nr:ATP synthase subunit C [Aminivibrio sp.]
PLRRRLPPPRRGWGSTAMPAPRQASPVARLAVAVVGAAALGVVGEKPSMLGTTLIYLGLAEGIAIYGVIVSLLILGKL